MRRCKKHLRNLIIEDCLKIGDFTLSSGRKSDYFIDLSKIYVRGDGAYLIGKTIYHHIKDMTFNSIGGPAMGAVPLVAATVVHYWRRQHKIKEGFYIRQDLGIEGRITCMHKAIVVEDVCTTGASAALAVKVAQEVVRCEVVQVLALVDREEGARERFQEIGIKFDSIFKAKKLLDIVTNGKPLNLSGMEKTD